MTSSHLSERDLNSLSSLLHERRRTLEESRRMLEEEARESTSEVAGEIARIKTHPADIGALESNRQESLGLMSHVSAELAAVTAADDRMAAGSYGQCTSCGADIPLSRLMAMPEAELCRPCQASRESSDKGFGKKFANQQEKLTLEANDREPVV